VKQLERWGSVYLWTFSAFANWESPEILEKRNDLGIFKDV
jgi:hypothetical protein